MEREFGDKHFGIWLLGDSEPENWKDKLQYPLDDRHPIVHNIWTSILDKIQDKLFRENKCRIDTHKLFIRNAVDNPIYKPKSSTKDWDNIPELIDNINKYKQLIDEYHPKLILSLGAFSYEFGRRCLQENPCFPFNHWGAQNLGVQFREKLNTNENVKLLPLLHRSIAGGKFIESHEYFCGSRKSNYFEYVANAIFEIIKDDKEIMIK